MALFGEKKYTLVRVKKKNIPEGIWSKCPQCQGPAYVKALRDNLNVCQSCGHHFTLTARERVALLIDAGSFREMDADLHSKDPLVFEGPKTYLTKLDEDQQKTGLTDAVITGHGRIGGHEVFLGVTDSQFIMGSMGSVVGERITRMVEAATEARRPVIIVSGSGGGARMYEGMFSLMQMAKTCAALRRHHEAGVLYISVLADPTMGGVMASFAGVGDVIIAEPKALIGFAGPRVIEQTTRQKLPAGFQRAEFLLAHGLIDMIVERKQMKTTLVSVMESCGY